LFPAVTFLGEALALLPAGWTVRCVPADSEFFDHALLRFLEPRAFVVSGGGTLDDPAQKPSGVPPKNACKDPTFA
jgi:hypothetical protein